MNKPTPATNIRILFCAAFAMLLFTLGCPAQAETVSERLERFRAETNTPGVALAVLRTGETQPRLFVSGLANVELDAPVTADSVFRIGSVTKVFTAVLTMKLVERGTISLDTTLERLVPELPDAAKITVRDLLQHSSGLPDFLSIATFTSSMARPWSAGELLALVAGAKRDFLPGERFTYSNSNYLVLGIIVERAGGAPYAKALADEITGPLGMTSTGLGDDRSLIRHRVAGYDIDSVESPPRLINPMLISMIPPGFSGGLVSTPKDMVRMAWLDRVLTPESIRAMQTPGHATHGTGPRIPADADTPALALDYGLGWELARIGTQDKPLIAKDGSIPGFASWLVLAPDKGLALAASANNEKALIPLLLLLADITEGRVIE